MKTRPAVFSGHWLICFLLHAASAEAQPATLPQRIDRILAGDFFNTATAGISVYDLTDRKVLYRHNERRLCRPASNMKLLTSAAALTFLTPVHNFSIGLFHTGSIDESGKLHGDIYIAGGFDPELSSADLDTMILMLRKNGIGSIEGNLFLDASIADSVFWGKAWSWDDDLEAFQPYLSSIPVNKGVVKLKVIPASPGRAPVIKTEPESSFIRIDNRATTVWKSSVPAKETLHFSRDCNGEYNRIAVSGTIAASSPSYRTAISLKNPNRYILTLFYEKMAEQFPGSLIRSVGLATVPAGANSMGYVKHTMAEAVRQLNKESDNLNAEMLLYALGYQADGKPSSAEKGIAAVRQMIAQLGLDPKAYGIVDGSGLSSQNYRSPGLLVELLKYMHQSPDFELFKASLPVAGEDGTLEYRMKGTPAHRKIMAKTGSVTGVSTLSGYARAANGHLLAFSIMIQNFVEKTSYVAGNYIDRICVALCD